VQDRYKTVGALKKKQIADKRRSGSEGGKTVEYQELLDQMAALDDSLEPDVMIGVSQIIRKQVEPRVELQPKQSRTKKKTSYDAMELFVCELKDIYNEKEENRNRRAREKEEAKDRRQSEFLKKLESLFGSRKVNE
jgi:hypothetical protein